MYSSLSDFSTSISISGKDLELCFNSSTAEYFVQNIEGLELGQGFTSYEFAYLIYSAIVIAARKANQEPEVEFFQVYEIVKSLKKTAVGQAEIERIAKSIMKADAFIEMLTIYERKKQLSAK